MPHNAPTPVTRGRFRIKLHRIQRCGALLNPIATYLLLVLAAVFWGGTFVAGRLLAPVLDPYTAAFLRFALASFLLLGWLWWRQRRLPAVTGRQLIGVILLGASGVFAYNLLFFSGLKTVEAGRASLIIAANPVLIVLASAWLFGERLGALRLFGVALSVFGAMLIVARGDLVALLAGGIGRGELLLLGCVLSWVAYTLIGRRLLRGMSSLVAVTYASVAGALMLTMLQLYRGELTVAPLTDLRVWATIVYVAVFGTVLAFVWYYEGVRAIGAARAGQFINLVPVSGVIFGAWLLNEPVTWSLSAGGILVLLGLWLTNRRTGRPMAHPANAPPRGP